VLGLGNSVISGTKASFSLTDISNLELWLQNNIGLSADTGKVQTWKDSSGNLNHATQTNTDYQANFSGGGLDFEEGETDHYDLASTITIAQAGGFCVAFVVEMETVSNNTLFSKGANEQIKIVNGTEFFFKADNPSATSTVFVFPSGTFDTSKALFILNRSAGASNRFLFFKNGTELTPDVDNSTAEAAGENPNGFDIDTLGSLEGTGSFFDGKILEVAFWNRALTATEIADVNSYLQSIHGL